MMNYLKIAIPLRTRTNRLSLDDIDVDPDRDLNVDQDRDLVIDDINEDRESVDENDRLVDGGVESVIFITCLESKFRLLDWHISSVNFIRNSWTSPSLL